MTDASATPPTPALDTAPPGAIGLALSGGGSRAAAFHVGTARALEELGLLEAVDRFSCVSGGAVFGALYDTSPLTSRRDRLAAIESLLARGVLRWRPSLLLGSAVGATAEQLERALDEHGLRGKLATDRLVLHAACLTDGKMVKLHRGGFSKAGRGRDVALPDDWTLARQVTASAAFPLLIPPLSLALTPHEAPIELTDGGVLDNLAVETLSLKGAGHRRYRLVVSDGEGGPLDAVSATVGALFVMRFPRTAARVMALQSRKGMRGARAAVVQQQLMHRLVAKTLTPHQAASMEPEIARSLVMVRVGETWDDFFSQQADFVPPGISEAVRESIWARYSRLGASTKCPQHGDPCPVPGAGDRAKTSPCLARLARRVEALQQIGTNFTPLGLEDARDLARHAEWQVHAQIAAFGEL